MNKSERFDLIWEELYQDISDRRGLESEWCQISHEVMQEIKKAWQEIILPHLREA